MNVWERTFHLFKKRKKIEQTENISTINSIKRTIYAEKAELHTREEKQRNKETRKTHIEVWHMKVGKIIATQEKEKWKNETTKNKKEVSKGFQNKKKISGSSNPISHEPIKLSFVPVFDPHSLHLAHSSPTFARLHNHHSRIYRQTFNHYSTRVRLIDCSFECPITNVNKQTNKKKYALEKKGLAKFTKRTWLTSGMYPEEQVTTHLLSYKQIFFVNIDHVNVTFCKCWGVECGGEFGPKVSRWFLREKSRDNQQKNKYLSPLTFRDFVVNFFFFFCFLYLFYQIMEKRTTKIS